MQPIISVIIPCRNEENFISKCLESIIEQDFKKENLEVLVVDGASEDKTKEIIKSYTEKYPFIKVLENPKKYTPFGLNIGIKNARGEIIVRMDAHAGYEKDYISKSVKYLGESGADNVGGVIKTAPAENTTSARTIALSISHFWGAGGSYFRIGSDRIREVDTVFGGCYKRTVFEKIGLFDERLIRSQDIEFNKRLKKAGGKILLVPDIIAYYYPQSTLFGFLKHNFTDGDWTTYSLKFGFISNSWRHFIPLIFVLTLPLGIWLYIPISLFFSVQIAFREKDVRLFFVMPLAFGARHFGYGLGSIWGLVRIILSPLLTLL